MQLSKKVLRKRESLRGSVKGTQERPRLSVFRSNQHIYAQVIDDTNYQTLISCSTLDPELKSAITQGNTCDASRIIGEKIAERSLAKNIKQIVGLQQGKVYNSTSSLRYGSILLLTDQDVDGYHIKGLLINFLHCFWPSLVKLNTFIHALATPIVKVSKGKKVNTFYNLNDYDYD